MTPASSSAASAGSSLTASDNPTIHSDPSCPPPPPPSGMPLASAGVPTALVAVAVAVAGGWLRRTRMRRSSTSTTAVPSPPSSSEMALASAITMASSTAGRGVSTASTSSATSESLAANSDLAPFVASESGSSASATTVPSPPASVTAVLLSATSASSQQQQLADAPMTRSSSSAASAGTFSAASHDHPNLVLYYTVVVCFIGLTRYCLIHDHSVMAAAAGATAVAIVAVSLVLNERRRSSTAIAQLEENAATAASAADEEAARLNGIIARLEENATTATPASQQQLGRTVQLQTSPFIPTDDDEQFFLLGSSTAIPPVPSPASSGMTSASTWAASQQQLGWLAQMRIPRFIPNVSSPSWSHLFWMMSATPASALHSMPNLLPLVVFLSNNWEPLQQKFLREREDRLQIKLTGPAGGGDPVAFRASMMDGFIDRGPDGRLYWCVCFDHDDATTDISILDFIETVAGLELRVGGDAYLRLDEATVSTYVGEDAGFNLDRFDEPQMGNIRFNSRNVQVYGRVGPILYHDYLTRWPQDEELTVPEFVQFLEDFRAHDVNDTVSLPQLNIGSVEFPQSQITGSLSVLQSMRVSTE